MVRPSPSRTSTVTTATSCPSASIVVRSAASLIFSAFPVVSCFSVSTTLPPLLPRASTTPGSYFTFHSICVSGCTFWLPWLLPLIKSSTSSRLECTQTLISSPSRCSQFQWGNRCSIGSSPHQAL